MIYFAHCKADYGNERERRARMLIRSLPRAYMSGEEILNPNNSEYQSEFEWHRKVFAGEDDAMIYWRRHVRRCDALAYLVNDDHQTVGARVATEVLEALVHGKPVFAIDLSDDAGFIKRVPALQHRAMAIEETRAFLRQKAAEASVPANGNGKVQ